MSSDKLNVDRLMEALSEIFSDKYGCKITFRAIPKDQAAFEERLKTQKENEHGKSNAD